MAEQDANSVEMTEEAVNAAAAKEIEQSQVTPEKSDTGTGTQEVATKTTDKGATTEQSFDAQKRYEDLEKRYKSLQSEFTPLSQERAKARKEMEELQAQVKQFKELLEKASEEPFNLEQFQKEFATKGPQALDKYLTKQLESRIAAEKEVWNKQYEDLRTQSQKDREALVQLQSHHEVSMRANDEKNYPNFAELYPKMLELAKVPENVDASKGMGEIIDSLYAKAKSLSSEEAVRIAAARGKKEAEAEIAKESLTTVAGGGKTASTSSPDPETMPLDQLEKALIGQFGVAER